MTKPTRKRYSFAPIYKSTLKRLFEQISVPSTDQIFLIFFIGKRKNIFRASSKRSPKKRVNLFCDHIFDGLADCVFSLRSLWNLGSLWHPTTYAYQAFVYSYGNRIFMVFIGSEPIRGESGTCWVRFPLFYNDRIKIPAVKYTSE